MAQILIVDDDPFLSEALRRKLVRLGHDASIAKTLADGYSTAKSKDFDVILLDVTMPDGNGLESLPRFRDVPSKPEVMIITGLGNPDGAELAVKHGAWCYLEKAAISREIELPLTRALQFREEKEKTSRVPVVLKRQHIIGNSKNILKSLDLLAKAAASEVNVLIFGETGTGKELFARAIHENSTRAAQSFVVVDCAALPETLVESTLFGHEKGAFTGAVQSRKGLIHQADRGTLFLDEVGELPIHVQKSFLRVLQEKRFIPVGGNKEEGSNFRLVAATNRDLEKMADAGKFRKDLLFRLKSMAIHLPPLRERIGDIQELVQHYVAKFCERYNQETKGFAPEFISALTEYHWPGNVRELIQTLERVIAVAQHHPTLYPNHLPDGIRVQLARAAVKGGKKAVSGDETKSSYTSLPVWREFKDALEIDYLHKLISRCGGNIQAACKYSGLSRARIYQLLNKHGMVQR
ncbi:MAG: sigma-54 dependent transcriptional regulator [Proteobacteria bacterium]|nr:sigma-54 dependent transcriptional regulator [Pseudomonadota bacterium]MBU1710585.1 sigma-54 dependent transcriptional regulator [Pseudomonadota bacterium]